MPTDPSARLSHLVVLMLENRSFDSVLGRLYPAGPAFDGLTGDEANIFEGRPIRVWNAGPTEEDALRIPDPDPGELFCDINQQIFGSDPPGSDRADMSGFVANYMRQKPADRPYDPRAVMHYCTEAELPATWALARAFGVSDRWFASAPCQTWPNRLFAHTGSAAGRVNNTVLPHPYLQPTIFRRLRRHGHEWRIYFHDYPQTAALVELWPSLFSRFRLFQEEFAADAAAGTLPPYSFIEPRYLPGFVSGKVPNDMHPPHNIAAADQLVADVYNALRASPAWDRTLLVVTCDEHGGCYDHVPPPAAVPPGPPYPDGFTFDRFGVRVPAILASPMIPAGAVIRAPADGPPFDHTSLIATLHRWLELGPEPTPRAAAAPDLLGTLSLPGPDNRGPERITSHPNPPGPEDARALRHKRPNGHQRMVMHPGWLIPGLLARGAGHTHRHIRRHRGR